jgi:hypothetical protein
MRARPDFCTILDGKLDAPIFAVASPFDAAEKTVRASPPRPVFLFGDLRGGFTAGPAQPAVTSGAPARTPVYGAGPGARFRPARCLTPSQQAAFDALRSLGAATLASDFTDAELKRAFRELARTFHPDRHPGTTETERARLARAFASLCDAYRTLTTAVH